MIIQAQQGMPVNQQGIIPGNQDVANLLQVAFDDDANINERIVAVVGAFGIAGAELNRRVEVQERRIVELQRECDFNNEQRLQSLEKAVDAAIKHFQSLGHAKVGGSVLGLTMLAIPIIGIFTLPISIGVCADGTKAYEFEQELRRIRKDRQLIQACLGNTTHEVEAKIQKLWDQHNGRDGVDTSDSGSSHNGGDS